MSRPGMPHRRARPGPDLTRPFTVLSGLVAVLGVEVDLRLPPGATWPGLANLPDWMLEAAQPACTHEVPGTTVTPHVTPRDIESGVALVHVQLLTGGLLVGRMEALARTVDPAQLCQVTTAALLGVTRESVSKASKGAA